MQEYVDPLISDIESYQAPMCFELSGRELNFAMDGGETISLNFAAFPSREMRISGGEEILRYDCAKIGPRVYFITCALSKVWAAFVLDTESGLITRIVADSSGQTAVTFGAADATKKRYTFTQDMSGNTVFWTLGKQEASTFKAVYGDSDVILTRPLDESAPIIISDFRAVKITDYIYLQTGTAQVNGKRIGVAMVSNFWNTTCVGCISGALEGVGARYRRFAGYGRYLCDYKAGKLDLRTLCAFKGGVINQYATPHCFELAGEKFTFSMDDTYDYSLHFIDESTLEWSKGSGESGQARYLCQKGDDMTYLVSFGLQGISPRVNHTFVIDRENNLVTQLISKIGANPKYPYLVKTEYEFGVIAKQGEQIKPYPRHGFTSDMVGNVVQWVYGAEMATVHLYYCNDYYRITYPRSPEFSSEAARMNDMFNNMLKELPSSDEPVTYIKIKDGLYLFTLTEVNREKILGPKMIFRSNTMSFLQNYKTMRLCGRSFGTSTPPEGGEYKIHISFAAYGKLIDPAGDKDLMKTLTDPNPYLT